MVECLINIRSIRIGMCNSRINLSALGIWDIVLSGGSDRKEQHPSTHLTDNCKHMTCDVTLRKTGPSICGEVLPLTLERR